MQSARDLVEWIAIADRQGVRILATPEAYIGGYPLWNYVGKTLDIADNEKRRTAFRNGAIDLDGPELRLIRDAANMHNVAVVVGANLRGEGANRYQVDLPVEYRRRGGSRSDGKGPRRDEGLRDAARYDDGGHRKDQGFYGVPFDHRQLPAQG